MQNHPTWCLFCSTRVSNELGAGNPKTAKGVVRVVLILGVAEAVIVSTVFMSCRHILGYAYSNDMEVVDYVASMAPLLCVSVSVDSLIGALSGEFKISFFCDLQEVICSQLALVYKSHFSL